MALYAVADIHGFFDETKKALDEAGFFSAPDNRLVVVGDALDRGKQARETVDFLLGLHREGRPQAECHTITATAPGAPSFSSAE